MRQCVLMTLAVHRENRLRQGMIYGALIGAIFGGVYCSCAQIGPRLCTAPGSVFSGAPKGGDDWIYYALARAVWRGPNQVTYAYPFSLYWPGPPVLIQIPITLISYPARLIGLPMAFELARFLSTVICGIAIGAITVRLTPRRFPKAYAALLLVLGGGLYWIPAALEAYRAAGILNLIPIADYVRGAMGQYLNWLPYLTTNVILPLETVYHALVFSALALLLWGHPFAAAAIGAVTWFSNPFPAIALSATAILWWAAEAAVQAGSHRKSALIQLATWVLISAVGAFYYAVFLPRWPALADLAARHRIELTPPYTLKNLLLVCGPGLLVLLLCCTPAGRRHILRPAHWRLMAILAMTQIMLVEHGALFPKHAMQPHHFNRGYMTFACSALVLRAIQMRVRGSRVFPRWAVAVILLLCLDPLLVWRYLRLGTEPSARISTSLKAIGEQFNRLPPNQIVLGPEVNVSEYVGAYTNQQPYGTESQTVIPFLEKRKQLLADAIARKNGSDVASLGIHYAVVSPSSPLRAQLATQGWDVQTSYPDLVLMTPRMRRPK